MNVFDEIRGRSTEEDHDDLEWEQNGYYRAWQALPKSNMFLKLIIHARRSSQNFMPRYDLLYDVPYSSNYDFVGLIFLHMHFRLHGRNLQELVIALYRNRVRQICEFMPGIDQFEPGIDESSQPCIDEIVMVGSSASLFP